MALLAGGILGAAVAALRAAGSDIKAATDPPPAAEADAVLAQFLARPDEPHHTLRGTRRMRAVGLGKEAFMEIRVALDPEEGLRFQIAAESGSRFLRDHAFLGMLEEERKVHAAGTTDRTSFTADNYVLTADGREGDGLVRLRARARRPEAALLDGRFVVTSDTADLVRAEGRLARSPSFWLSRVEVVRHYRRIQGHRVQARLESVAHLRLLGEVRITVDFEYEMVDGDELTDGMTQLPVHALPSAGGARRPFGRSGSHADCGKVGESVEDS